MNKGLVRYSFVGRKVRSPQDKSRLGRKVVSGLFLLLWLMRASEIRAQEFAYITNGGAITIIGYSGPGGAVTIPGTINGVPVTAIGGRGFSSAKLTSVTIPNSVTNVGDLAFESCSLSSITIGDNVTSIGMDTFAYCTSLATVTIPDNVLSLGAYAFMSCSSLTNVIIGKGLTNLPGDSAFYYCTNLMAITVDKDNQAFRSASGVLFNRSQTELLRFPSRTTGSYDVPPGVMEIGRNAFSGSTGPAALTIPNSVTNIAYGAFQNCPNLTGIYFRGSAPSLDVGPAAFFGGTPAVIYYLPGTAGWGVSFGGRPTALWVLPFPVILTSGPGFGVQSNQFGFTISWATNLSVVVEAATDLGGSDWSPVATNALSSGTFSFTDQQWMSYPSRFYRVRPL